MIICGLNLGLSANRNLEKTLLKEGFNNEHLVECAWCMF